MQRRAFLRSLLALAALLPASVRAAARIDVSRPPEPAKPCDPRDRHLAALGEHLERYDPAAFDSLCGDRSPSRLLERFSQLQAELLRPGRRAQEFDAGQYLRVDGWVLTRSEAALCATAHGLQAVGRLR